MAYSVDSGLSRRAFLHIAAGATVASGLSGCVATNPATGRQSFTGLYSPEDDIKLGQGEHPKLVKAFGGEYPDRKLQSYIQRTGQRLAAHTEFQQFPYRFTLLNSPIVNAFALPGGFVYISRGLLALASNEAELAGVLGHELGHVNARHSTERISATKMAQFGVLAGALGASLLGLPGESIAQLGQQIALLSIKSYSRSQEFEADMLGVRYMSKAGYEPDAMVNFLASLHQQSQLEARSLGLPPGKIDQYNMLSTHPRTVDRVREAQTAANTARPVQPRIGRKEYLSRIDGMLFGDDPSDGIIQGRRFVHPGLRFEFTVPAEFRIRNSPEKVIAQDRHGTAIVFDIAPIRKARDMRNYIRTEWATKISLRNLEALTINGFTSATATTRAKTRKGVVNVRMVALRRDAKTSYRLLFITPQARAKKLEPVLRQTTFSFRALSAQQAKAVSPLRLHVQRFNKGTRIEQLANQLPYGALNSDWFRVLNDIAPGQQPASGQTLKLFHV